MGSLWQEQRRGERDKTSMDTGSMVVTFGERQQRARVAQPWPMVFVVREWVRESRCVGVFWGFNQVLSDVLVFGVLF